MRTLTANTRRAAEKRRFPIVHPRQLRRSKRPESGPKYDGLGLETGHETRIRQSVDAHWAPPGECRKKPADKRDVHSDSSSEPASPLVRLGVIEISFVGQHRHAPLASGTAICQPKG